MRLRRETGGQHKVETTGQITVVMPILIHDRQTFDAAGLRSGLRDIDNLRIKVTRITGEFLINKISNLVGQLAQTIGAGIARARGYVALRDHIPQHKFNLQFTVGINLGRADKQPFCAKRRPVGKIGTYGG